MNTVEQDFEASCQQGQSKTSGLQISHTWGAAMHHFHACSARSGKDDPLHLAVCTISSSWPEDTGVNSTPIKSQDVHTSTAPLGDNKAQTSCAKVLATDHFPKMKSKVKTFNAIHATPTCLYTYKGRI